MRQQNRKLLNKLGIWFVPTRLNGKEVYPDDYMYQYGVHLYDAKIQMVPGGKLSGSRLFPDENEVAEATLTVKRKFNNRLTIGNVECISRAELLLWWIVSVC